MKWAKIIPVPVYVEGGKAEIRRADVVKGDIVVLAVHGPDVTSRIVSEGDPILRRIEHNESLLWTRRKDMIYYVPREAVEGAMAQLKGVHVAETTVCGLEEDAEKVASERIARLSDRKSIAGNRQLLDCVAGQWYQRLRLPVLLFWLVVLLVNFFASSALSKRIGEAQLRSRFDRQRTEQAAAVSVQQQRMVAEYKSLALPESSGPVDGLAAVLPENMLLSRIQVTPSIVVLKGNADEVPSVVAFARELSDSSWNAEIRSLDENPDGKQYRFEIVLTR